MHAGCDATTGTSTEKKSLSKGRGGGGWRDFDTFLFFKNALCHFPSYGVGVTPTSLTSKLAS